MVAKESLRKIARMEQFIQTKKERLAVLKDMSSSISSPRFDDMPRNTRNRLRVPTRSMAEIRLYAVGTDEHGNESVTSMYHSILSVNCALRKGFLCL